MGKSYRGHFLFLFFFALKTLFYLKDGVENKWPGWRDKTEQRFQWKPEERIELQEIIHGETRHSCCLHLQNEVTIFANSFNETFHLYYDHQSDQKVVEQLKLELEKLKIKRSQFEIDFIQMELGFENSSLEPYSDFNRKGINNRISLDHVNFSVLDNKDL